MYIGRYILELLQEHNSVILPGLGTFTLKENPSLLTGEQTIAPPSAAIRFISEVRINDGLLLNYLARKQGISAPKGHLELLKICDDIQYRLDHGETVLLEGLGELTRNEGTIVFESSDSASTHPGSFGLKPVVLRKRVIQSKAEVGKPLITAVPDVRNKKKVWYLWLIALPAVAAPLLFLLLNSGNDGKENQKQASALPVPEVIIQEQSAIPDTIQTDTGSAALPVAAPQHPVKGLYYLVGGSFKTRENAGQYYEKMAGKGFNPVHLGEIGNFHVVAISVYSDMGEAARAQVEMLNKDSTSGVWVYYLPESE